MEFVKETEVMSPVQAARHAAREEGRKAKGVLTGVCGLTKDEQIERLTVARGAYLAAAQVMEAALAILEERDEAAYMATKHQGAAGWTAHMAEAHGLNATALLSAAGLEVTDEAEVPAEVITEIAYQIHKTLPQH